jgi:hypothetical protein
MVNGLVIFRIVPTVGVIDILPDDTFLTVQYIPCDAFAPGRTRLVVDTVNKNVVDWLAAVNVRVELLISEIFSRDVT